jgi:hypothetical protein
LSGGTAEMKKILLLIALCIFPCKAFAQEEWLSLCDGFRDLKWGDIIKDRRDFKEDVSIYVSVGASLRGIDYIRIGDKMQFGKLSLENIIYRTTFGHVIGVFLVPTSGGNNVVDIISKALGPPAIRKEQIFYVWRLRKPTQVSVAYNGLVSIFALEIESRILTLHSRDFYPLK